MIRETGVDDPPPEEDLCSASREASPAVDVVPPKFERKVAVEAGSPIIGG